MQINPKLASFNTDELIVELIARRGIYVEKLNAALELFNMPSYDVTVGSKKAPVAAPAKKRAAAPVAPATAPAAKPRAKVAPSADSKPVRWWIVEALKRLGKPSSVPDIVKEMLAANWPTASEQPYSIVFTGLNTLKTSEIVSKVDKLWTLSGADTSDVGTRKPRGRAKRATVAAVPASEPEDSEVIDDPSAVLAAMDGALEDTSHEPDSEPSGVIVSTAAMAPPQLREGESFTHSNGGSPVIRRQS